MTEHDACAVCDDKLCTDATRPCKFIEIVFQGRRTALICKKRENIKTRDDDDDDDDYCDDISNNNIDTSTSIVTTSCDTYTTYIILL